MAIATPRGGLKSLRTLSLAHTSPVVPREVIVSGGNVLVAVSSALAKDETVYIYRGPVSFPKGSGAIASATKVYWNAASGIMTTSESGNTPAGITLEVAASSDNEVLVSLKEN